MRRRYPPRLAALEPVVRFCRERAAPPGPWARRHRRRPRCWARASVFRRIHRCRCPRHCVCHGPRIRSGGRALYPGRHYTS